MSTYTRGTKALVIARGRPWRLPLTWQSPSGVAIDITGFTLTAQMRPVRMAAIDMAAGGALTVVSAAEGKFRLDLTADVLEGFPEGAGSELAIRIIDSAGASYDFELPVLGVVP